MRLPGFLCGVNRFILNWSGLRGLAALLLITLRAAAQETPPLRHFVPAEYGGQNQNWSLGQDSTSGYMYFGNNAGVLCFDGVTWQQWHMPEKQTVRAVAIGPHGEVFCGAFADFGYWLPDPQHGQPVYHSLSKGLKADNIDREEIWNIVVCRDYVLFQSFSTLYKYDYQTVTVLSPPGAIMFATQLGQRVLLPVIGLGVYELLPDNTFRFVDGTQALGDRIVQFLVPGEGDALWIGTAEDGIFVSENGRCTAWNHPLNGILRGKQLNRALQLSSGGWVFGTILDGVYFLDPKNQRVQHLHRGNGLQNNTILAILEDKAGDLWLGLDKGLDHVQLNSALTYFLDPNGLLGTVYTAAWHQGRLYVGSNQGVFVQTPNGFQLLNGTQGQVWQLEVFGDALLCGHNSGTFQIENGLARRISPITGGWHTLRAPGRSDLLLQASYTGLLLFRSKGNAWVFDRRIGGFAAPLRRLAFDKSGNLWGVHPNRGLYRLRINDNLNEVREFKLFTKADGLPGDYGLDLSSVGDSLILSTAYGAFRLNAKDGAAVFEALGDKRSRQKYIAVRAGEHYLCDSSGLYYFVRGKRVQQFDIQLVPQYEQVLALQDGIDLFCLEDGYALFRREYADRALERQLYRVQIRNINSMEGGAWLPVDGLKIPWQHRNLRVWVAAPVYAHAPRFKWALEGPVSFSGVWERAAFRDFNNLPPGTYSLNIWVDSLAEPEVWRFQILPPWYRSWWAVCLYVMLLLAVFWATEWYNRRRLKQQRAHLEAEKREALENQKLHAEREILVLEVENKNRELSNAAFNLIRKNEVLQSLREELRQADASNLPKLVRRIDAHLEGEHDWEIFEASFNRVHDEFFKRLMQDYPELTPGDLRLAAFLKMNLASKEIAPLLNISVRGVENKRYRLRRKLGLPEEANLTEFLMSF